MRRIPSVPVLLAGLSLVAALPASAQTVDYSALQDMIGEPVTTSVTGKPQRASELPASTVIITAAEIARSPARDVPGLLKSYAGIDVNRWSAGQADVAVRGGVQTYNARLLVLVDGRQVYLDHYGMTNWNLLGVQLEEIQQIELVRGPASALFGFNAASGVVNIITRKVGQALAARASMVVGDHGRTRLAGTLSVPIADGIGAKIAAGRLREDERRVPDYLLTPTKVGDVAADQVSGELRARHGATEATIGGGYATNRQVEYLPSQFLSNQDYRSTNVHAVVTHDTDWGGLTFNGFVNWLDAEYGRDLTPGNPGAGIAIDNRIASVKASGLYRLGTDSVIRLGGEYRNNRMTGNMQSSDTIEYDVASVDGMLDLHIGERVSLTTAARWDRLWLRQSGQVVQPSFDDPATFDRAFSRVSLNAALLVQVGAAGQLRINGGHGYQLPSLVHYGLRLPLATPSRIPVFVVGSPAIEPVGTWSGELGYTHLVGGVRLEATGFYTRTSGAIASPGDGIANLLEFFFTPQPVAVARFRAAGDYATYGVELAASGRHGALSWRADYTGMHTDEQLGATTLPIALPLSPRSTTPRHKANVELGYDAGGRWYATAVARYTSATRQFAFSTSPQLLLYPIDDAVALDARVGRRVSERLELFAAGENLTLARGAALSPIPADRRVRGGMRLVL